MCLRNKWKGETTIHIRVPTDFERSAHLTSGSSDTDLYFHHAGTYVVFDLDGPLALPWIADELLTEVHHMLDGGRKKLIIDLADVPYADSAGVGALMSVRNLIQGVGGRLVLVSAGRRVLDMLKRLRLANLFTFRNDKTFAYTQHA